MKLVSPSFTDNSLIPELHTCDDQDISPELHWSEVPKGTESFVLIVDDPDAVPVAGFVWDHWILFNIPAEIRSIAENSSQGKEGMTSFDKTGYGGPCPPNGEHLYVFKIFAVDSLLDVPAQSDKKTLQEAMEGHILDQAVLRGRYDRKM